MSVTTDNRDWDTCSYCGVRVDWGRHVCPECLKMAGPWPEKRPKLEGEYLTCPLCLSYLPGSGAASGASGVPCIRCNVVVMADWEGKPFVAGTAAGAYKYEAKRGKPVGQVLDEYLGRVIDAYEAGQRERGQYFDAKLDPYRGPKGWAFPVYYENPWEWKKGEEMADTYASMGTEELVKRLAWDKATAQIYKEEDMETPEALLDSIEQLQKFIRARKAESEARELKLIEQKLDNLKTQEEKRADLIAKRDRLLAKKGK